MEQCRRKGRTLINKEVKHSKTPYSVRNTGGFMGSQFVLSKINRNIAVCLYTDDKGVAKKNAEFIVEACNNHEKAMKLLKKFVTLNPNDEEDVKNLKKEVSTFLTKLK